MPRSRVTLLSWVVAVAFVLATVLLWVDRLNVVATPPKLPDDAGMVDRVLGSAEYRQAIWPVFLWTNLLFAIGFVAAVAFAAAVRSAAGGRDGLPTFVSLATTGGIIGAIASIIPIGSVDAAVWLGYCDCVSRETEVVSQVWAQMIAQDVGTWFSRFASVVLAVGLVAFVREAGAIVSPALRTWTYVTALALVVAPVLGIVQWLDPVVEELPLTLTGLVLVPAWAVWLGRSLEAGPSDSEPEVSTA